MLKVAKTCRKVAKSAKGIEILKVAEITKNI